MSGIPQAAAARIGDYAPDDVSDLGVRVRGHRNETSAPISDAILTAIRNLGPDDLSRYPAGRYEALARIAAEKLRVSAASLVFANGSDDLILALATAYAQPGTNVVVARPTFAMYGRATRLLGGELREVPFGEQRRIDATALLDACDADTRLIFLAHPNNPTGEPLARATLEPLLARLPRAVVVVDEAYLSNPNASYFSDVPARENLAVIATLSKVAGLAGLRCGYGAASPEVARAIRRVMQPHPLSAPALVALSAYFTHVYGDGEYRATYRAFVAASLDRIVSELGPLAMRVTRGDTNFVVLEFGERAARVVRALAERGIAVRRLSLPEFDGGLRVNALPPAQTAEFIETVASALGAVHA